MYSEMCAPWLTALSNHRKLSQFWYGSTQVTPFVLHQWAVGWPPDRSPAAGDPWERPAPEAAAVTTPVNVAATAASANKRFIVTPPLSPKRHEKSGDSEGATCVLLRCSTARRDPPLSLRKSGGSLRPK